MAIKHAGADLNISSANLWSTIDTGGITTSASSNVGVSSTVRSSSPFTAPNLVSAVRGVWLFVGTVGVRDWTITLFETSTRATATVTAAQRTANQWLYVEFAVPYTFATLTANAYVIRTVAVGGTDTGTVASYSVGGSTIPAAVVVYDTATSLTPGTDSLWTNKVVTVTGTANHLFGSSATTPTTRSIDQAAVIAGGGRLELDTTANCTLMVSGQVQVFNGGEITLGTSSVPVANGVTTKLEFQTSTTSGLIIQPGGKHKQRGETRATWKGKYVSGLGTALSPMVADANLANVGDQIAVTATGNNATNYSETEYRFVIAKPTATTYVLSSTAGGAEAALANTHSTDAHVLLLTRNSVISSSITTNRWYYQNTTTIDGDVDVQYARFEYSGSTSSGREGIKIETGAGAKATFNYVVGYTSSASGFMWQTSKAVSTFTGLIYASTTVSGASNSNAATYYMASVANKTLVDCFSLDSARGGLYVTNSANNTFTRFVSAGNNKTPVSGTGLGGGGGVVMDSNSAVNTFNDCEITANRNAGIYSNGSAENTFNNCSVGDKGANVLGILIAADTYMTALFSGCTFGSDTLVTGNTDALPGTLLRFHELGNVKYAHYAYSDNGIAQAGEVSGTRNHTIIPSILSPTGRTVRYKVLARPDTAVSFLAKTWQNATFVADAEATLTAYLYLPGSSSPDATQVISKSTAEAVIQLAALYTGDIPAYAEVRITAKADDSGSEAYIKEIFNGTNDITNFEVWDEGEPSPIMFEQLGDASAVWAVSTSTLTTTGTTGKQLRDALTTGKFLGLK